MYNMSQKAWESNSNKGCTLSEPDKNLGVLQLRFIAYKSNNE